MRSACSTRSSTRQADRVAEHRGEVEVNAGVTAHQVEGGGGGGVGAVGHHDTAPGCRDRDPPDRCELVRLRAAAPGMTHVHHHGHVRRGHVLPHRVEALVVGVEPAHAAVELEHPCTEVVGGGADDADRVVVAGMDRGAGDHRQRPGACRELDDGLVEPRRDPRSVGVGQRPHLIDAVAPQLLQHLLGVERVGPHPDEAALLEEAADTCGEPLGQQVDVAVDDHRTAHDGSP